MKQENPKAFLDQLVFTQNSLVHGAARVGILLCRFQQVLLVLPVGRADRQRETNHSSSSQKASGCPVAFGKEERMTY